jgi:hypothetical protein
MTTIAFQILVSILLVIIFVVLNSISNLLILILHELRRINYVLRNQE